MSVSRVRHRGQEPRDVDHGPSSGRGQGGAPGIHAEVARIAHAEASKLTEVGGRLPGGSGAIERRMATEAQREAWRATDVDETPQTLTVSPGLQRGMHIVRPPRPAMNSPEHLQQSRMRGAARHIEVIAGGRYESRRSIAVAPSPEPVTPEESMAVEPPVAQRRSDHSNLQAVASAAALAAVARATLDGALQAVRAADAELAEAETAWAQARAALEASWRATGIASPVVESGADHAETIPAGEPGRTAAETRRAVAAAGGGPGRPAYVARMLEAMVAAGGDFTAAAEALQIKRSSLVGSMSVLRARTDLTEAEAAAIARTRVRKA